MRKSEYNKSESEKLIFTDITMSDVWTSQVIKEELYDYMMAKSTDNWRGSFL